MQKYPEAVIITIDDDVIYPPTFIEESIKAYKEYPNAINAFRCHKIIRNSEGLLPYKNWEFDTKMEGPSNELFFTGVGGVIYPPGIFKNDINEEDINNYIRVDDILLNYYAKRKGIKVRKIPSENKYKDIHLLLFKPKLCVLNIAHYNDEALQKIKFINVLNN